MQCGELMRTFKKIPLEVTLVVIVTLFIAMRLTMVIVAALKPPQDQFLQNVFWIGYPIIAFIWGVASHPADYKWWLALVMVTIGMGAGLTFWNGYLRLVNLPVYMAVSMLGYGIAASMFKPGTPLPPKKKKQI